VWGAGERGGGDEELKQCEVQSQKGFSEWSRHWLHRGVCLQIVRQNQWQCHTAVLDGHCSFIRRMKNLEQQFWRNEVVLALGGSRFCYVILTVVDDWCIVCCDDPTVSVVVISCRSCYCC
jgi:hypothetical protein